MGCEARHVWESAWLAGQRERVAVTGQHTCIYRVVEVEGVGQAGTGPPTIVKLPIRATLKAGGEEVVWAGVVHTLEQGVGTSKSATGKRRILVLFPGGNFTSSKVQRVSVFETIGGLALSKEVQEKVKGEWTSRDQGYKDGLLKAKVKSEAGGPDAALTQATAESKARVGKGKGKGNKSSIDVDAGDLMGEMQELRAVMELSKGVGKEGSKGSKQRDEIRDLKGQHKADLLDLKTSYKEDTAELKKELQAAKDMAAQNAQKLLAAQNAIAGLEAEKKSLTQHVQQLQEVTDLKKSLDEEKVKLLEDGRKLLEEKVIFYKDQLETLKANNVATTPRSSRSDNSQRSSE